MNESYRIQLQTDQQTQKNIVIPDADLTLNVSEVGTQVMKLLTSNVFDPEIGALTGIKKVEAVRESRTQLI